MGRRGRLRLGGCGDVAEPFDPRRIGEDRELLDEELGRTGDRLLRLDRAVGGDLEDELVVVRALPDARGVDLVRDTPDGREDRVDRDDADRRLGPTVQVGQDVPATAPKW